MKAPPRKRIANTTKNSSTQKTPLKARTNKTTPAALSLLVASIGEGREDALAALYEATVSYTYGLAFRITGNSQTAEDVTETTYWQAWRQARRFDPKRGSALGWLLSIARSRALDTIRQAEVAELHPAPETLIWDELAHAASPQDLFLAAEQRTLLHAALETLDPLPRQLIALSFFRGLTHEAIAAHLGLPLGTVKTHIRRAIRFLRRALRATLDSKPSV